MRIEIKGAIVPDDDKPVYEWLGIGAVCPKDVSGALKEAGGKPVLVEINSGGGEVFAGAEIYSALKAYKGKVNIRVVGLAGSAASVILCAGESEITPPGMVMIHNAHSFAAGDYHDMDKASEASKAVNESIAAAYQLKTGKTQAELLQAMDAETWMSSKKAVEFGLVDRIIADKPQIAAAIGVPLLSAEAVAKARNVLKNPERDFEIERAEAQEALNILKGGAVRL
jgi:ATP-dependent Clp endopeptidase proteolytic subunit ClpP